MKSEDLLNLTRMWRLNGNDRIDDAKQLLSFYGADLNRLPIAIQATLL